MYKSKKWAIFLTIILANTFVISIIATTFHPNPISQIFRRVESTVGAQKAKEIALNHANLDAKDVFFTKAQLNYDDLIPIYEVEFFYGNTEYDYKIIDSNGQIKEFETEKHSSNILGNLINFNKNSFKKTIGAQKAKDIALNHADLKANDVFFTKAQLGFHDQITLYRVEFVSNSKKYYYEIIASSGEVRLFKIEDIISNHTDNVTLPSNPLPSQNNWSNTSNITVEKAKQITLDHAHVSEKDALFKKVKLDHDDGIEVYEIEFYYNDLEYNYEINASNGTIIEFDIDRD